MIRELYGQQDFMIADGPLSKYYVVNLFSKECPERYITPRLPFRFAGT